MRKKKHRLVFLSYPIAAKNPHYGKGMRPLKMSSLQSMKKGDRCNTFLFEISNHTGTHVDCPAHFIQGAPSVNDFQANEWHFSSPQLISVKLKEGELLKPEHLSDAIKADTDILLFKSGWGSCRHTLKYGQKNPGVHSSMGTWLRTKYPSVRVIGFDWISLSSFLNRDEGRIAHRVFLDPKGRGQPIRIIEDMDLRKITKTPDQLWVLPVLLKEMDSAPCTVIGVFR